MIIIIIIIIIIITPNIFLAHTPAGAQSDLNAAAAAPSRTEVTDLNCSDHSTTSGLLQASSATHHGETLLFTGYGAT